MPILTTPGPVSNFNIPTDQGPVEVVAAPGQSSPVAASSIFIFRPGGVAAGNVYTTWASLMAATALVSGFKWIHVDTTIAPAHATAGNWNVDSCVFTNGGQSATLIIDPGCTWAFTQLRASGLITISSASTAVVAQLNAALVLIDNGATLQSTTAAALFEQSGALSLIFMASFCVLGDNVHPAITVDAGKQVLIDGIGHPVLQTNALVGLGQATFQFTPDALINAQSVTTFTQVQVGVAGQMSYAAGVVANWSGTNPSSVANALDRLAAKATPVP